MNIIWPNVDISALTVSGVLVIFVLLFARGLIISRKVADQEQRALIVGHEAKDDAHLEVVAFKNEQIEELRHRERRLDTILEQREHQLTIMLEEVGPALQQWSDATQQVFDRGET